MLLRSRGMRALQKKFRRKVLMATVQAHRPPVSPEELVKTLRAKHGIRRRCVLIEVYAPPQISSSRSGAHVTPSVCSNDPLLFAALACR